MLRTAALLALSFAVACGTSSPTADGPQPGDVAVDPPSSPSAAPAGDPPEAPAAGCAIDLTTDPVVVGAAAAAGEHVLTIEASSVSRTSWAEKGNEAVVLEVLRGAERVGHVVLHQGQDPFAYGMHVGALAAGDELRVRVSPLTAARADKRACLRKVTLDATTSEGVLHAPIVKWPTEKAFDDLPVLLGWSKTNKSYQLTYTNENGGTVALCGGGARGMRSEIARWGRGLDMEGVWAYGGAGRFERCTGVVAPQPGAPRMKADHPVLYYGDGHNRVFESRGGYGKACGSGSDKTPDGALLGWNQDDPGDGEDKDDPFTIVLRPLPVDLDALGYAKLGGRREGIVDTFAPWLYRLTSDEMKREGKIDGAMTLPLDRYLFVDVYANDVGGSGDATCGPVPLAPEITKVSGGFVLRAIAKDGTVSSGPQMTADYFGGGGSGVKRVAIPLAPGVRAADVVSFVFDAYDGDGIYFLGIGDAFVPRPSGAGGATLDYVNKGRKAASAYVDDDQSSCAGGTNTASGVAYPCVGSTYLMTL